MAIESTSVVNVREDGINIEKQEGDNCNNEDGNNHCLVGEQVRSNTSELSYSGEDSLCLSLKDKYKVISKNQLMKVELPMMRVGIPSLDCGISFMEEISDTEDDYDENPYETRTRKEKIRDGLQLVKDRCCGAMVRFKRGAMKMRTSLSKATISVSRASSSSALKYGSIKDCINRNVISRFKKSKKSECGSNSGVTNNSNLIGGTGSSIFGSRTLSRLNISTSSRGMIVKRKIKLVTNKVSYVLKSRGSYVSKRIVNFMGIAGSKMVYNYHKVRNIIGEKFPKRRSKFVLYFKRGSENEIHKVVNCETFNDQLLFENEMLYDSVEYMSGNAVEEHSNIVGMINGEREQGYVDSGIANTNDSADSNSSSTNQNPDRVNVKARIEEFNSLTKCIELSKVKLGEISSYGNNNSIGVNKKQHNHRYDGDRDITPTTIDSFPRLSSMDSTTCTIHNDCNHALACSTPKLSAIIENVDKLFEKIVNMHRQVEKMNIAVSDDKQQHNRQVSSKEKEVEIDRPNGEYNDIFLSVKTLLNDLSHSSEKKTYHYYESLLALMEQIHGYYENITLNKNPDSHHETAKNFEITKSIRSLIEKLNVDANISESIQV